MLVFTDYWLQTSVPERNRQDAGSDRPDNPPEARKHEAFCVRPSHAGLTNVGSTLWEEDLTLERLGLWGFELWILRFECVAAIIDLTDSSWTRNPTSLLGAIVLGTSILDRICYLTAMLGSC